MIAEVLRRKAYRSTPYRPHLPPTNHRGWRHTYHNPVRKFANTLMAILLGLEVMNTVIWLIGVNLSGVADGSAPWKPVSPAKVDRWCFPISVVNYWLDPMMCVCMCRERLA